MYVKSLLKDGLLIFSLYLDDVLVSRSNEEEINDFKHCLMSEFEMSDMGMFAYFLGIDFIATEKGIFISQRKHVEEGL